MDSGRIGPVVYVTVGNTDDRLPQRRWAVLCAFVRASIHAAAREPGGRIVFEGAGGATGPYQNAVWALVLPDDPVVVERLRSDLRELAGTFEQDAIVWAQCPSPEMLAPDPGPVARRRWLCRDGEKESVTVGVAA